MSLIIDVSVNEHRLFTVSAQRVSNTALVTLSDDTVSDYRVFKCGLDPNTEFIGTLSHRYGDGASVLARKALHAAEVEESPEV